MKRRWTFIVALTVLAAVCYCLGYCVTATDASFVDVLVLPFMALLAGVAVGTAVFVVQTADAAKQCAISAMSSGRGMLTSKWKELEELFNDAVSEVKEDFTLILILTLGTVGLAFWHRIDLPGVTTPLIGLTKIQIIHATALFCVVLALWAVYDIVVTMFGLRKAKAVADDMDAEERLRGAAKPDPISTPKN